MQAGSQHARRLDSSFDAREALAAHEEDLELNDLDEYYKDLDFYSVWSYDKSAVEEMDDLFFNEWVDAPLDSGKLNFPGALDYDRYADDYDYYDDPWW